MTTVDVLSPRRYRELSAPPELIAGVAHALGVTFTAARQVLEGETDCTDHHSQRRHDRNLYLHRRGVLP